MKKAWILLLGVLCPSLLHAQVIPTPAMAVTIPMGEDNRKWISGSSERAVTGFISELVPDGQTIDAWKEMVAQQVTFTNLPLRQYVDGWKAAMQGKDAQIQITESSLADGSLVVEYTSLPFQETAIRRFIQCSDGIYALAYHVRPQLRDEGKYKIWLHIIDTASVIPNPKAAAATHPENPQEVWFADFLRKHGGKDFYPPHDATINSLMQVVQDYYKAHPELGGKLMENQILQALIEKYPTPVTSP